MKIIIVCGAGMVSGKEIMALELGQGFRQAGHDVQFITSLWGDGKFRERLKALHFTEQSIRIGFISATLSWNAIRMTANQLIRLPGLWLDYGRFLRREKPAQVIHTNWHHLLVLWPFLSADRDWFWLHEIVPKKPQYQKVFGALAKRLKGFIAVSQAVRNALLEIGIPAHKIQVIHNGLTDPSAGLTEKQKTWKGIRIGIAGQIEPWKGHQDLFAAFAQVTLIHPEAELHVFGSGSMAFRKELETMAERGGFSASIVWHGFVADRSRIYHEIDLCVVPSRAPDPLPTSAIEAAFFGIPTIVSRSGGLPEIVEDGVTGFLVDVAAPEQLAEKLDQLIGNPVLCEKLGRLAKIHATNRFNKDRFTHEFVCLLGSKVDKRAV